MDLLRVALLVPRLVGVADGDVVGLAVLVRSHGLEKNGGTGSNTATAKRKFLFKHSFLSVLFIIFIYVKIVKRQLGVKAKQLAKIIALF